MSETIVMIHGMWGGPWNFENFKAYFEREGYRCVTPTLRFHDMDPRAVPDPRLGTTSLLDYAADLEKEIRALGAKPVIVGHSMGGLLAQMLGARGLARALVLQTPASPAGIVALRPSVVRSFWSVQTRWGFWKKPMCQSFAEAVYSMMHLVPAEERRRAYERYVYESGRAACEIGYWMFDPRHASRVDSAAVNCPVLVVAGAEDRITPAAVVRQVAKKYEPVSTYKEFERHAHWMMAEPGWEEAAGYAAQWLRKVLAK
jgi:pimeloyl-ACP methyl ester carboxylesterase